VRSGLEGYSEARFWILLHAVAWLGKVWCGKAWQGFFDLVSRRGRARYGMAWCGEVGQGLVLDSALSLHVVWRA
jgi:hypothetical protein